MSAQPLDAILGPDFAKSFQAIPRPTTPAPYAPRTVTTLAPAGPDHDNALEALHRRAYGGQDIDAARIERRNAVLADASRRFAQYRHDPARLVAALRTLADDFEAGRDMAMVDVLLHGTPSAIGIQFASARDALVHVQALDDAADAYDAREGT